MNEAHSFSEESGKGEDARERERVSVRKVSKIPNYQMQSVRFNGVIVDCKTKFGALFRKNAAWISASITCYYCSLVASAAKQQPRNWMETEIMESCCATTESQKRTKTNTERDRQSESARGREWERAKAQEAERKRQSERVWERTRAQEGERERPSKRDSGKEKAAVMQTVDCFAIFI